MESHRDLKYVLRHARKWRCAGTITLCGLDIAKLERWRDVVPSLWSSINTFPRDALIMSKELTVMLRSELKSFKTGSLIDALFSRLQGTARVACSKKYGKRDYTAELQSKDGWRLCYIEGDPLFMQSLSQFVLDEQFEVGCGLITIRGGVRKPSFLHKRFARTRWPSRKWSKTPSFSFLSSLKPVPSSGLEAKQPTVEPIPSTSSASQGVERASLAPAEAEADKQAAKPRTRSERLKIQREKKLKFKRSSAIL